jgi:hypothetical protein
MAMNESTYLRTLRGLVKRHQQIAIQRGANNHPIVIADALAELLDAIDRDDTRPWETQILGPPPTGKKQKCLRCGSPLDAYGFCTKEPGRGSVICPYGNHTQQVPEDAIRSRSPAELLAAYGTDSFAIDCTFRPQETVRKDCFYVEPDDRRIAGKLTTFKVPLTLVLSNGTLIEWHSEASDGLRDAKTCPAWTRRWNGPYEVDFDDDRAAGFAAEVA